MIIKYSEFKKMTKKKSIHVVGDLASLEEIREGQKIFVKDNRTEFKEDHFEVFPVAFDENGHVFIVCPLCRNIHRHGNSQGSYSGSRVAHCDDLNEERYYKIIPAIV